MHKKAISLALGFMIAAGTTLYAGDAFEGTWKLNESKSKLTKGTGRNTTVVYSNRGLRMGKTKVTGDGVDANGKPSHSEWSGKWDGKDYEVTGDPTADTRAYTKVNDHTLNMTVKKGGKVVATGQVKVAADGKSRVVTVHGTTEKGKKFTNMSYYDKQ